MRCLSLLYPPTNERIERCVLEVPFWLSAPRLIEITRTKHLHPRCQAGLNGLETVAHAKAAPGHVTRCPVGSGGEAERRALLLRGLAGKPSASGTCHRCWLPSTGSLVFEPHSQALLGATGSSRKGYSTPPALLLFLVVLVVTSLNSIGSERQELPPFYR